MKAGQRAPFTVDAKGAGDGELDVFVEGPLGEEKVDVKNNGDGTYSCCYYPGKFGKYVVNVTWSSVQVPSSPFNVKVAPAVDASRIKAYGPGLEKGTAGKPCEFTVETKGAESTVWDLPLKVLHKLKSIVKRDHQAFVM